MVVATVPNSATRMVQDKVGGKNSIVRCRARMERFGMVAVVVPVGKRGQNGYHVGSPVRFEW